MQDKLPEAFRVDKDKKAVVRSSIEVTGDTIVDKLEPNQCFLPKALKLSLAGVRRVYLEEPVKGWVSWRPEILQVISLTEYRAEKEAEMRQEEEKVGSHQLHVVTGAKHLMPPPESGSAKKHKSDDWLWRFCEYLIENNASEQNVKKTMKVVSSLAQGKGVSHPRDTTNFFAQGQFICLDSDLQTLQQKGLEWLPRKDDSSGGWGLHTPLRKLIAFQDFSCSSAMTTSPAINPFLGGGAKSLFKEVAIF